MIKLKKNKINLLIDGQLGSTGKDLLANYISANNHIDVAITDCGPNAGHTFYHNLSYEHIDKEPSKIIVKHLPVAGIIQNRCSIYLCAGSIIDPVILFREMEENNISADEGKITIHPRAAIITLEDINEERSNDKGVKTYPL